MKRLTVKADDGTYAINKRYTAGNVQEAVDRLAAYEDLEEQGRLMMLPCSMGSTIYMIVTKHTKGREPFSFIKTTELMESNVFRVCRDFGKTVFLTREDAERAMEGGNNDA